MKQDVEQSNIDSSNRVGSVMEKILNVLMTLTGGFFLLMGSVGILTGDYFFGGLVLAAGLILTPYVRSTIARLSGTTRISGVASIVIFFVLIVIMSVTLPPTESIPNNKTEQVTPVVTLIVTPTPEEVKKHARDILPERDELGDGSGWTREIISYTDEKAKARYYKDDYRIIIEIDVCKDITTAYQLYWAYHGDRDTEYPPIEYRGSKIGDLSMVGLVAEETYGLASFRNGYFIDDKVVVSINIRENSWGSISINDVGRYAKQIEKKI